MREVVLNQKYQISRSAELESLKDFREYTKLVCKSHQHIQDHIVYDLMLAVDEACTNIITHGYAGKKTGTIILTLLPEEDRIVILITDFGHAFEPSQAPVPDVNAGLSERPIGGFGLYLINKTMDFVDYQSNTYGNRLKLIKDLNSHQ